MRKLHLTFWNADGSRKTFIIHQVAQNLTPEKVYYLMGKLIDLQLFVKNGVQLCTAIHSAKYVEIITTPLFDVSKDTQEEERLERLANQKFAEIVAEEEVGQANKNDHALIEQMKFPQNRVKSLLILGLFYQASQQLFLLKTRNWQRGPSKLNDLITSRS
ncbi:hypothetical protein M2139_001454 [Enterococcus sp. PF1-24]|uniref:DUF2922 domain-containing protein n=1 Tax=unclassified Enterococcus TaxID=2608891 RepID=UPI0024767FF0|nr:MULTISPECIES: DUF2922 domain-containing protein [unclassified Enterococcus]MDH6364407.1 hypothetical protein [Enterococcus sp. PFB1-1]MDH6401570.1 hypothetical protein [Enterococcus sp. PF1-24]